MIDHHEILARAAQLFGYSLAQITGKRGRAARLTEARQAVMYALRETGRYSLVEIGRLMGGRDHTTVIYATRQAAQRAADDPRYAAQLHALLLDPEAPDPEPLTVVPRIHAKTAHAPDDLAWRDYWVRRTMRHWGDGFPVPATA